MKRMLMLATFAAVFVTEAETYIWTGGGNGTSFTDAANWGQAAIDFDAGHSFVIPSYTGGTMTFDRSVTAYSISFGEINGSKTVAPANGAVLTLGAGGLYADAKRSYWYFTVPVKVRGDQVWTVVSGDFYIGGCDGGLMDDDPAHPATIYKMGDMSLMVSMPNSPFKGTIVAQQGYVSFEYPYTVSADAHVVVDGVEGRAPMVRGYQAVLPAAVDVRLTDVNNRGWNAALSLDDYGQGEYLTFAGPVTYSSTGNHSYLICLPQKGGRLTFAGGVTGTSNARFEMDSPLPGRSVTSTGHVVVEGLPWTSSGYLMATCRTLSHGRFGHICFNVASNSFASLGLSADAPWYGCDIATTVDDAFAAPSMNVWLSNNTTWDLAGTRQRVGSLATVWSDSELLAGTRAKVCNTAEHAATLMVNQTIDCAQDGDFAGCIDLVKDGTARFAFTRAGTAFGDLDVRAGCLAFTVADAWGRAERIDVADGATLEVAVNGALGAVENLRLGASALLQIPQGVDLAVNHAVVNGVRLGAGVYSSTAGADVEVCPLISGGGSLTVYGSNLEVVDGVLHCYGNDTLREALSLDPFTNITVAAGTVLTVADLGHLPYGPDYRIDVGAGGGVALAAGLELLVKSFTIGGVAQTGGVTCGGGKVYVQRTYTWNGAPGARFSQAASWLGGELPDFTARGDYIFPPMAPGDYMIDVDVYANSLEFQGLTANGAPWIKASGGGRFTLGEGGISVDQPAVEFKTRYFVLNAPVCLKTSQTWSTANYADFYIIGEGAFSCASTNVTLAKTGPGKVHLQTPHSPFNGTVLVKNGWLMPEYANVVAAEARLKLTAEEGVAVISPYDGTIVCPVDMTLTAAYDGGSDRIAIRSGDGQCETFAGAVSYTSANQARVYFCQANHNNSRLVFTGGITGDGSARFRFNDQAGKGTPGRIEIRERPWVSTGELLSSDVAWAGDGTTGRLVFAVPGNVFASLGRAGGADSWGTTIETAVDGAFDNPDMPLYFSHLMALDLCGTSQRIGDMMAERSEYLEGLYPGPGAMITNSLEQVATLRVVQKLADNTWDGGIGGNIDFVLDDGSTKTLTLPTAITAQGSLTVKAGTLALTETASWKGAANIAVSGTGVLRIANADALDRDAELTVDSLANLDIPADTMVKAGAITIGGVRRYGGRFACGAGVLEVKSSGTRIFVR